LQRHGADGNDCKEMPMKKQTAQILGGLAVGAAGALAMYLLDPVSGKRRRERIREETDRARRKAREAVHEGVRSVRVGAEDLAARLRAENGAEASAEEPVF
jgi:gas vesicle protein